MTPEAWSGEAATFLVPRICKHSRENGTKMEMSRQRWVLEGIILSMNQRSGRGNPGSVGQRKQEGGSDMKTPTKDLCLALGCFPEILHVSSFYLFQLGSSQLHAGSAVVMYRLQLPHVACRILVPQPGIEPESSALAGRFLTTGPLKEVPPCRFLFLDVLKGTCGAPELEMLR